MADESYETDVKYRYLVDTEGLEKGRTAEQALAQAIGANTTAMQSQVAEGKKLADQAQTLADRFTALRASGMSSEQAIEALKDDFVALQRAAGPLAQKDLAQIAQQMLKVGENTDGAVKRFASLSVAEKYVNAVKISALNLRGAVSSLNKDTAEMVGHFAGVADAGADAAQGIANYGAAESGAAKFSAGLTVATNVLSAALELTAAAVRKIDKAADDYAKGAQQRFFSGTGVAATQHRQLNEIIEVGWDKFDKAKSFAENYAEALKWVQEQGGLVAAAADNMNDKLTKLGVSTESDVALKAQEIGEALAYMKESMGLSEEEATKKLAPALKGLQDDLGGLADKEVPNTATALIELGKQYDVMGDKAKAAGAKATASIQDQIKAIRDGLAPAMQAQLDVMTKLRGATEESSLAQADNLKWTQDTALQTIKAKLAAGEYIEATDYMAAGVSDLSENSKEMANILKEARKEIDEEAQAAEKAAASKTKLADAEESVGEATQNMSEGVAETASGLDEMSRASEERWGEMEGGAEEPYRTSTGEMVPGGQAREQWPHWVGQTALPGGMFKQDGLAAQLEAALAEELATGEETGQAPSGGLTMRKTGGSKSTTPAMSNRDAIDAMRNKYIAQSKARGFGKIPGVVSGVPDPRLLAQAGVSANVVWDPGGPAMKPATGGAAEGPFSGTPGWSPGLEGYGTGYSQGQGGGGDWAGSGVGGEGIPLLGPGVEGPGISESDLSKTTGTDYAGPGQMSDPAVQQLIQSQHLKGMANVQSKDQLDPLIDRLTSALAMLGSEERRSREAGQHALVVMPDNYLVHPIAPFRLDGEVWDDGAGSTLRFDPSEFQFEEARAITRVLGNAKRTTSKMSTAHGMHGPTATQRKVWPVAIPVVNPVLHKLAERRLARDIRHHFAVKMPITVSFDGGPNPVEPAGMTEAYLDAYVLSNGLTRTAGKADQSGAPRTPAFLEVRNEISDGLYAVIVYRSVDVTDNAALVGGDTITVTAIDWEGAVLTSNVLTAGVEWAIGGNATATAVNIAAAIDALAHTISSSVGAQAFVKKQDVDTIVLTLAKSSAGLAIRPSASEVALDVETTFFRFRNLKFGQAPGDVAGAVTVTAYWLYPCEAHTISIGLAGHVGLLNVDRSILVTEEGLSGPDPEGAP